MLRDWKIKNFDVLLNSNGEYEAKNHHNQYLVAFCSIAKIVYCKQLLLTIIATVEIVLFHLYNSHWFTS